MTSASQSPLGRQLTDSEMAQLAANWRRYKSEYETEPTHIWPFEHGFSAGLDYQQAELAALTAERDALREALTDLLDWVNIPENEGQAVSIRGRAWAALETQSNHQLDTGEQK